MSEHHHSEHHHSKEECYHHEHHELRIPAELSAKASEVFINKHGGRGTALNFPCRFPIKVFGKAEEDFLAYAHKLVQKHVPELSLDKCRLTHSSKGRYVSVTIDIIASSREQLDAIYADLKNDERIAAML
ncbi:MAG: YbeD family protein [Candidatus Bruticola sp.]